MKLAIIGAGKWGLTIIERILGKAQYPTLSLRQLQQLAHTTSRIGKVHS